MLACFPGLIRVLRWHLEQGLMMRGNGEVDWTAGLWTCLNFSVSDRSILDIRRAQEQPSAMAKAMD